jgi:hypothetical protein
MYCAVKSLIKVCTSITTTGTSSAAASCGGYKLVDLLVIEQNTTCTVDQIQLTTASEFALATASPWVLSNQNASFIVVAILTVWALGYSTRLIIKTLNLGSPE